MTALDNDRDPLACRILATPFNLDQLRKLTSTVRRFQVRKRNRIHRKRVNVSRNPLRPLGRTQ